MSVEERNTFTRNVRLSTTWFVILAFVVNPAIAAFYFWYAVSYQTDDGFFSRRTQILLPFVYGLFSFTVPLLLVREREEARLKKMGYEQRSSWFGQIEWGLGVAVLLGVPFWMNQWDWEGITGRYAVLAIVFNGVAFWTGIILAIMGPVWLFTERVG